MVVADGLQVLVAFVDEDARSKRSGDQHSLAGRYCRGDRVVPVRKKPGDAALQALGGRQLGACAGWGVTPDARIESLQDVALAGC